MCLCAAGGGQATAGGQAPATPHATYFRYVFQQPEAARDLVLNVLRPEAGVELPPDDRVVAVEPQSLSLVAGELAEHRSDLLLTLRTASGREGVLAVVNSLNQASLPGSFREATVKYLAQGRDDNARMIVATMQEEGYTVMGETMISYAESLRREAKLQAALDEIIEPSATRESVLSRLSFPETLPVGRQALPASPAGFQWAPRKWRLQAGES